MAQQGVENSISGLMVKTKIGYLFTISNKLGQNCLYIDIYRNNFSDHYQSLFSLQACFMDRSNPQGKQTDTDRYI